MLLKARACPDRHFICLKENGQICKIEEYEVLEEKDITIEFKVVKELFTEEQIEQ